MEKKRERILILISESDKDFSPTSVYWEIEENTHWLVFRKLRLDVREGLLSPTNVETN